MSDRSRSCSTSADPKTPLHVAVSGWLLGEPSGANRRLLALVEHAAAQLGADEHITVLHRPGYRLPDLHPRVYWHPIAIPVGPAWRRAYVERRLLPAALRAVGANVLDHALLPLPKVPVPVCATIHDLRAIDGQARWPRWLSRRAVRTVCARAAAVVVPSDFTAARVRAVHPGTAIDVIPNGVALPPPIPAPPTAEPNGYLLHTGHLERRKNVALLLRALARLPADERPELRLVGRDAGDAGALRALVRQLQLSRAVHFLGVIDDAELRRLHAGARAVVVPSTYEGFGFAALDGLAFGRPTLVADAGALPEVVGHAGVVLPPDDAAAWADAIAATAIDAPAIRAARRDRAITFDWPRAATAMLAVWRRVVSAPRP